eukprot:13359995-Alexandrium_andersonii.AAC.1
MRSGTGRAGEPWSFPIPRGRWRSSTALAGTGTSGTCQSSTHPGSGGLGPDMAGAGCWSAATRRAHGPSHAVRPWDSGGRPVQ